MEHHSSQEYDVTEFSQESMPVDASDYDSSHLNVDNQRDMYSSYNWANSIQGSINYSLFTQPFLNQCEYPMLINLNSLPSMLNENRKKLISATKASNEGEIEQATDLLQRIHK